MREEETSEGRYAKMFKDLKAQLAAQEHKISELETEAEEYKRMAEDGEKMSENSDVGGGNNNLNGNGEERDNEALDGSVFVDSGAGLGGSASGQGVGGVEASPSFSDPLSTDWAQEMEGNTDTDTDNPLKRKDVSPLGGGDEKRNSKIEEIRRKYVTSLHYRD